jgi:hypothetical protein
MFGITYLVTIMRETNHGDSKTDICLRNRLGAQRLLFERQLHRIACGDQTGFGHLPKVFIPFYLRRPTTFLRNSGRLLPRAGPR